MRTRTKLVLGVAMMALLLTGCWDRQELGDLAIVSALGIDVGS